MPPSGRSATTLAASRTVRSVHPCRTAFGMHPSDTPPALQDHDSYSYHTSSFASLSCFCTILVHNTSVIVLL